MQAINCFMNCLDPKQMQLPSCVKQVANKVSHFVSEHKYELFLAAAVAASFVPAIRMCFVEDSECSAYVLSELREEIVNSTVYGGVLESGRHLYYALTGRKAPEWNLSTEKTMFLAGALIAGSAYIWSGSYVIPCMFAGKQAVSYLYNKCFA